MLRRINLGPNRRIAMADLRRTLTDAGYEDVETYVQSGNIALSSPAQPAALQADLAAAIQEQFGIEVPVIVRSARQLKAVVAHDPIEGAADDPKRYQVSFLDAKLPAATVRRIHELAGETEQVVVHGREVYAWHPDGVARSKLWNGLAGQGLGVTATARNWTTVVKLLEMASG